jgi:hypothetical protein
MRGYIKNLLPLFVLFSVSCASAQHVQDDLHGQGAVAEIHGAPQDLGHYVATIRDPDDFFKFEYFSLLSEKEDVKATLAKLKRHDKVRMWGDIETHGPQKHIVLTNLAIETPTNISMPDYHREADFPASFPAADVPFRALVHAIVKDQRLLVIEYKDAVLPVRVPASIELPDLYKNDIVEMKATVANNPGSPKHLKLVEISQKQALVSLHGTPIVISGALELFPKSPQVLFDVYAVKENLPDGLSRQYTLVNFDDQNLFQSIRAKAEALWKAGDQSKIVNGRNKLVNPSVIVKVSGTVNVVDRGQANPQIIITKLDDLSLAK